MKEAINVIKKAQGLREQRLNSYLALIADLEDNEPSERNSQLIAAGKSMADTTQAEIDALQKALHCLTIGC